MEIKKIITMFIIMLISFTVPATIFAAENSVSVTSTASVSGANSSVGVDAEVTADLESEVGTNESIVEDSNYDDNLILSDMTGAQIRLLQLGKAIDAQIEGGNNIIEDLKLKNTSQDVLDNLSIILVQLDDLKLKIDGYDFNQSADILASDFVSFKSGAIDLSKEFKTVIHNNVKVDKISKIRENYQHRKEEILKKKNQKLEELKNKFNAKLVERKLNKLGVNNSDFINKIKNGQVDFLVIKKQLKDDYNKLDIQQKKQVNQKLREEFKKAKIDQKRIFDENKKRIQENRKLRDELRVQLKRNKELLKKKFNHINELRRERLGHDNKLEEKLSNIEDKMMSDNNSVDFKNTVRNAEKYIRENNLSKTDIIKFRKKLEIIQKNHIKNDFKSNFTKRGNLEISKNSRNGFIKGNLRSNQSLNDDGTVEFKENSSFGMSMK